MFALVPFERLEDALAGEDLVRGADAVADAAHHAVADRLLLGADAEIDRISQNLMIFHVFDEVRIPQRWRCRRNAGEDIRLVGCPKGKQSAERVAAQEEADGGRGVVCVIRDGM